MLLTEMTLLVRAYKEEVNIERAKAQALISQPKYLTSLHSRSSSRPQSSKPASSLASSRSSRPQSRQRPQTASPIIRDSNRREQQREMEREQEERDEDERQIMALRQVAHAPVTITSSRDRVERMKKVSVMKRLDIADTLAPGIRSKGNNRPTTAPLQRQTNGKSSVLSSHSKKKKRKASAGADSQQSKNRKNSNASNRATGNIHNINSGSWNNEKEEEQLKPQNQPYVPTALIRTTLRNGFVHNSTSAVGPDGIALPSPLITSESAPLLQGNKKTRPKSSPFIRFGSSGIQTILERKKNLNVLN
jgi:hypothetical protein